MLYIYSVINKSRPPSNTNTKDIKMAKGSYFFMEHPVFFLNREEYMKKISFRRNIFFYS